VIEYHAISERATPSENPDKVIAKNMKPIAKATFLFF